MLGRFRTNNFFIRKISEKNDKILRGISRLQIEVTNNCNLSCRICWRTLRNESVPAKNLTFACFKKAIDNIASFFDIRELNTQGLGEPFMCPDILAILKYAKSKGLAVWLVTNGTLVNDDIARGLVEIGVDKIRFSVDTADGGRYAAIKSGSSLDVVSRNIFRINLVKDKTDKNNPIIAFNSVVLKSTLEGGEGLIEMAANLKVSEITLIPLVLFSGGLAVSEEQVDFYGDGFNNRFKILKDRAARVDIELNLGISLESREDKFCHSGFYVDVDGFVHPCCSISLKNFGSVYSGDMRGIAEKYLSFRSWLDNKMISCKECNKILDSRC